MSQAPGTEEVDDIESFSEGIGILPDGVSFGWRVRRSRQVETLTMLGREHEVEN
jgi:hypothetical protein